LERSLGTSKRFIVVVRDGDIIVGASDFHAVYYYKPTNQPQLILRRRSEMTTTNFSPKHGRQPTTRRELGWIV
jgi:hypothetical protein